MSLLSSCVLNKIVPDEICNDQVHIFPDYKGITIPPNIAPLNFAIGDEGDAYRTEIGGVNCEATITYTSSNPKVYIQISKWKKLLSENKGGDIYFRIYIRKNNKWIQYPDIINKISTEEIDPYLVYRLLYPGYELWNEMGIYERDLTSFKQKSIVENKSIEGGCVNCHTFTRNSPNTMLMHIRGKVGGTLIRRKGTTIKVDMKVQNMNNRGTYVAWHPDGDIIAFSMNDVRQYFHLTGNKPVEVTDLESDLAFYDCNTSEIFVDAKIANKAYMETFPNWAPDGRSLYFCRTDALKEKSVIDSIYYDLYKVEINVKTREVGEPICIYKASEIKKSVSFPRVSPDGKYLMFTLSDYGNFSIWHPESDLYLLNLSSNKVRCINEVNSDNVESFHTWSSSGKWFVFSSKRMDGLWARPYLASFDPSIGKASKAFVLPQKDPYFYTKFTKTYNLPELIVEPIKNKRDFK